MREMTLNSQILNKIYNIAPENIFVEKIFKVIFLQKSFQFYILKITIFFLLTEF